MARIATISDHYDGKEFRNLDGVPAGAGLWNLLRWKLLGGPATTWPKHLERDIVMPQLPPEIGEGEVAATFVGHSTFLLQFAGGLNVLTDPVWSARVSPVTFAGPRRVRPPAVEFDDLPPIHVVLVSHSHYDHLDLATLRRLDARFAPQFITGLGNQAFLQKKGLHRVIELDWWQECRVGYLDSTASSWSITFTPAQHWSARSALKPNVTLWGGFWLQSAAGGGPRVYFAGDSGFGRCFALVRERLGAPDIAFLPIGAYEPRWFMQPQHMNPDEAVQAHQVLGARRSVAMHFGTFQLTDEGIDEPTQTLAASLQERGVKAEAFCVPLFGQTLQL